VTLVRVAAHVHSEWSYDGERSLQDIVRTFRRLRYDVVLMAEHDRTFKQQRWDEYRHACAESSTRDILLVPGIEYEDPDNVVHIPVWGANVTFLGSRRPTLHTLRAAAAQDAASLLAHPGRRNAFSRFSPDWAPLLSGVEVWNRRSDGVAPCRGARALAERHGLAPFVSLDFHTPRQLYPLAMSISLDGPPSAASLIRAIRSGACRPQFLGLDALRFTGGASGMSVRVLEDVRRGVRGSMRRLQGQTS
jgi:predicted metal-dependent phosphoesterase TrpH